MPPIVAAGSPMTTIEAGDGTTSATTSISTNMNKKDSITRRNDMYTDKHERAVPTPAIERQPDCDNCTLTKAECANVISECMDSHVCGGYYYDDNVMGYRCDICDSVYLTDWSRV